MSDALPPPPPAPGYGPTPPAPRTSSNAVVALVLALLSWALCPVILAVGGLVLARSAQREIEASNGWVGGSGLVTATRWVAWINIVLSAVVLVVGLLFLIGAVVTSTTTTTGVAG
ncbi:MAG: hypothetical protein LCI03_10865 [Actinobacteria bacterium]|nr:hypothetical protein [Actinomycetota bacterium]